MNDEISESAKAIQEVAKVTRTSIEATQRLGSFVARVTNESIEAVTGILADKLRFMRWERQLRLRDRCLEIMRERGIDEHFQLVPPKLALPIVENASLEEDDELQDLWANLLASALDPNFEGRIRTAFIDILKQLEAADIRILYTIFLVYKEKVIKTPQFKLFNPISENDPSERNPIKISLSYEEISTKLLEDQTKLEAVIRDCSAGDPILGEKLDADPLYPAELTLYEMEAANNRLLERYIESIDNLIRLRCVMPYVEEKLIETQEQGRSTATTTTYVHSNKLICLTNLGVSFIEACTSQKAFSKDDIDTVMGEGYSDIPF